MNDLSQQSENDFVTRLKWLMFLRVLFTALLLGSTILFQSNQTPPMLNPPFIIFFGLIGGVFALSVGYALVINRIERKRAFVYFQIGIDTVVVSLIIFLTGSYSSIFSFLYLVVIIYASMLLFRKGSMIMASLCSIQYGIMIDLEYYRILNPYGVDEGLVVANYAWNPVFYKIIITMAACFAVAFLSSYLAEREKKTKQELLALEDHVKRVEKIAAIGEVAAGLAHEIKNPLASLSGSIQLIKDDISHDPEHEKLMRIISREADRLNDLISSFLLFAKPPAGKPEAINLSKALSETIDLFEQDGACRGRIEIRRELIGNCWVEMDPGHLRQIAWNLLLNAVEAIECKGEVEVKMYPIRNKYVGVSITDNGCGITKEVMKSIFDPFFTTKPKGSGLGLSIVYSMVETYGGRLTVDSRINEGATFTLKLKEIDPPRSSLAI